MQSSDIFIMIRSHIDFFFFLGAEITRWLLLIYIPRIIYIS